MGDKMKRLNLMTQISKLDELRNQVNSQIHFHSIKNEDVQKVHFQKVLPVLNRLMSMERYKDILSYFNPDSYVTDAQQLLDLLSRVGEITKVQSGYYLPLPIRIVQLQSSKKRIALSKKSEQVREDGYIGLASGYLETNNYPCLSLEKWLPSMSIEEFVENITNSVSYELIDKPDKVFLANKKRTWRDYDSINKEESYEYIAKFSLRYGPSQYYWVQNRKNNRKAFLIPNQYLDIAKYALEERHGIKRKVDVASLDQYYLEVKFSHRIPEAEQSMLMLFAFPENFYDPFEWIVPVNHIKDFSFIVGRLGMKTQEVVKGRRN
jgi:hypothetical protein